jgi:hypothetical protein
MKARIGTHTIEIADKRIRMTARPSRDRHRANALATAPYKSRLEAGYAAELERGKQAGIIIDYWYEPFSFQLATGKRYRPDFVVWHPSPHGATDRIGRWAECVEVKGVHKNRRDSLTHLAWASQRFPLFVWHLVWWTGRGWDGKYL